MKHSNIAFFIPHLGCPHACSFCNQHNISGKTAPPTPQEIRETCTAALNRIKPEQRKNCEIAFFGGSFTAIDRADMLAFLQAAAAFCGDGLFAGIRISTRPDAVSEEILDCLKRYQVSAIELGVQSLEDEVLRKNGRGHTVAEAVRAAERIRLHGFSLGLQMMTGLYGDSNDGIYRTAAQIIALKPDTVRIYPTVVLKGTKLCELYEAGVYQPPNTEETIPLAADLIQRFEQAGIRVIRVGLHATPELEQNMVAGAYHPAFRELCEGEIYYQKALEQLKKRSSEQTEIFVAPSEVSKMVGQSKRNLKRLLQNGFAVKIKQAADLSPFEIKIQEVTER